MNQVILIGNLTKDPEIRVTQSGTKFASFTIAVDDGKDGAGNQKTQFINCTCWTKAVEFLEKYAQKGTKLAISGKIENSSWTKQDGTKGYSTKVVAFQVESLSGKPSGELKVDKSEAQHPPQNLPNPQQTVDDTWEDIVKQMPF